jgi:N-acetylglucosamine-6-phosphate deacetylase
VSRPYNRVKNKHGVSRESTRQVKTVGAVDVHFHGAFGIDLMSASPGELTDLSSELWKNSVAGFCATTLSTPKKELRGSVERLGRWISSQKFPGAIPLGIHLEGPFIHPHACGAHPPKTIRPYTFSELEDLWEASRGTLKILTLAPERLTRTQLTQLSRWCATRKIVLSLGHSQATDAQADLAFREGFRGVTHAWNALNFHHRAPGVLGAALGRTDVFLEIIGDRVHVSPRVISWTRELHPKNRVLFVSDCVPAASTRSGWHRFGPLKTHFQNGACWLSNGALAGGGLLLPEAFSRSVKTESDRVQIDSLRLITQVPLAYLGVPASRLGARRVAWTFRDRKKPRFEPIRLPFN